MKIKTATNTTNWVRRLLGCAVMVMMLIPESGFGQTLTLGFTSPATNASPGQAYDGSATFSPTNMVITGTVTAGTSIVPQENLDLTNATTDTLEFTLTPLTNKSGTVTVQLQGVTGTTNAVTNTVSFTVVFKPYPPTISSISNQNMDEDTTHVVAFTIDDPDTNVSTLQLSRTSSNTNLINTSQMIFGGGTDSSRTLTLTPIANAYGTSTLSVAVSDGSTTNTRSFQLVVNPVPDPPTISAIANRHILEDGATNVTFTVNDPDNEVPTLQLTATSSNTDLLNTSQMVFGGGTNTARNITLTPTANHNGTSTVTIKVSDGIFTNSTSFQLVVDPVPDPSTINGLVNSAFGDDAGVTNVFAGVAIADVDHNRPVSEQLVATAFLDSNQYALFTNNQTTFSTTGTPAEVTAAIASLGLQPRSFSAAPGVINNVSASVKVRGIADGITVTNTIALSIEVINTPPTFLMLLNPTSIVESASAQPFYLDYVYDPNGPEGDDTFTLDVEWVDTNQAALVSFNPIASVSGNTAVMQTAIRNISVNSASGVMTNLTVLIPIRYVLTDGYGGTTSITNVLTLIQQQNKPLITGVPSQTISKYDADPGFVVYPTVVIQDQDQGGAQQVQATLTQSMPALGDFSTDSFGLMTQSQLSAALQGLTYDPLPGVIPVGAFADTILTLTVTDSAGLTAVNSSVKVRITGVNNAPLILNVTPMAQQPDLIPPVEPILPFGSIGLTNDDTNQVLFTLTIDNIEKGTLSHLGGFSQASPGVYSMSGTTLAILSSLTNITYALDKGYLFPSDDPGGTTFTLSARDYVLLTRTKTLYIQIQEAPRHHLVIRTQDDGLPGSFTYALQNAGNSDVITFALPSYPAVVRMPGSAPTTLIRNITIKGPGANLLTISGDGNGDTVANRQLFRIRARVTIEGVTLTHGTAAFGGAMQVESNGFLTLRQCSVVDSIAAQYGGAIDVDGGQLTLDGCFIGRNRLMEDSGLSGAGVSVYSDKEIRIINTTFADNVQPNVSGDGGGALVVQNLTPSTPMSAYVTHSTFVGNVDASDAASAALSIEFGTRIRILNSIFSDFSARNLAVAGAGQMVSLGGNICDDTTKTTFYPEGLLNHITDLTSTDPMLGVVNLYGDPTPFFALLPGSPAIGKATTSTISVDQRGVIRDVAADAGSIEYGALGRAVINEIFFDASGVNYVELFVPRDSTPVDFAPYSLLLDGVKIHDFAGSVIVGTNGIYGAGAPVNTVVNPGFGMLVAFTNSPFAMTSPSNMTPVAAASSSNALSGLPARGQLTIGRGGTQEAVARQSYLGTYLNPQTGTNVLDITGNSISLVPQFCGFALLPHSFILPGPFGGADTTIPLATFPTSAGADSSGTPFGQDNAEPLALADMFTVSEDDLSMLPVLLNDYDSDGNDRLVIVDVSPLSDPNTGDVAVTNSQLSARVQVDPAVAPLRGARLVYDPRLTVSLQALPVGVEIIDSLQYEVIDIGSASVAAFSASGTNTAVTSIHHRLKNGDDVRLSGSSFGDYSNTFSVTVINEDSFSIPVAYPGTIAVSGIWETVLPRAPTARSEASVSVRVIGINDTPVAMPDVITNVTETSTVRMMTRPELAGSPLSFPADPAPAPVMLTQDVLSNDLDVDADDTWETLRVVGVLDSVNAITGYSGTPGQTPVTVQSPAHGLTTGDEILMANYGGHSSYNGYHTVTVIDGDSFTIDRQFVDNNINKGVWVVLNETNRYSTTTDVGAEVTLTLRANQQEDHILYNASASPFLQHLAEGELYTNRLYYAVEDSHGGIGIGTLDVIVAGLNNVPVANPDPDSLGVLASLVSASNSLADILSGGVDLLYVLPPASGSADRVDLQVLDISGTLAGTVELPDFLVTDEDTALFIDGTALLANDSDIDTTDLHSVIDVDATSREGATLSLGGGNVTYDPSAASNLQALVRGELRVDTFEVVVSDSMTDGTVTSLVAVLVIGVNDRPVANPDSLTTHEDERFVFDPRLNDTDIDINGMVPDNRLGILPVTNVTNPGLAAVDMSTTNVTHDATVSALLNQLADWQSFTNVFNYTITDNSFLFAVDDAFYVPAGTTNRQLDVLANDRNFTDAEGPVTIIAAGPALRGGAMAIATNGQSLSYSSPSGYVGDDHFRYTIRNDRGDTASGQVMVRSVVPILNGLLPAADDAFTVAAGETVTLNVLANDNMLPLNGAGLVITALANSSVAGQPVLTNNALVYTATNGLTPLTFSYDVTAGGTSTSRADVVVNLIERRGILTINDDTISVQPGSFNNDLDVLANDGLVTASIANLRIKSILDAVSNGTLATNGTGTRLVYTPQSGFIGTERVRYLATDQIGGTGTGRVTIVVGAVEPVSDFYTVAASTNPVAVSLPVLSNDRVMPNPKGTLTILSVEPATPTAIGTLQVAGSGANLLFTPSNSVGQLDFTYTVRDAGDSYRTSTGRVTIATVSPGVYANPDRYLVQGGGSGYVLPVLTNDVSYPNVNKSYSILSIGTGADAPNHGGLVTISGSTLVYTPSAGFFGDESFTYVMSDSVQTDVAQVTVSVRRGNMFANDDDYSVYFENEPGTHIARRFTLPVLLNDRIHPPLDQTMTINALGTGSNAPNQGGSLEMSSDHQSLLYRPAAIPVTNYVEQFTYEVSDGGDRRASGTVRVRVENRVGNLVALTQDDHFTVARGSVNNPLPVIANDSVLPGTAAGWTITGVSTSAFGGAVSVSGTAVRYSPPASFTGMDSFTYRVSDGLGGTGNATVFVQVGNLPVLEDRFVALAGSTGNVFDVVLNDVKDLAYADEYTLDSVFGVTAGGSVTLSGSNKVLYVPDSAYAGVYPYTESFMYRVGDAAAGMVTGQVQVLVQAAGSGQSSSTITLLVEGRNDQPSIVNNSTNWTMTDKQTLAPFTGITIIEVDQQLMEPVDVQVSLDLAAKGSLGNLGSFSDLGGGSYLLTHVVAATATLQIRALIFDPTENRITVPTTEPTVFTISVTDHKSAVVLDTNTTVRVTAVNDLPVISGTVAGQEFYYRLPIQPFSAVTVTEVDDLTQQPLGVTVSVMEPANGQFGGLGSFASLGNGVYRADGITAAEATAQLRAMAFIVNTAAVPVGGSLITHFRLTVNDGFASPVDNTNTTAIAHHPYEDAVQPASALLQGSFGLAVDTIGDFAVVGAPNATVRGTNSGSAFIYQRAVGATNSWLEWRQLQPATVTTNDRFGRSVSMTTNNIAVGAINDDTGGTDVGAVYLFDRNLGGTNNWGLMTRLAPTNLTPGGRFGLSVAMEGDLLAVGAPDADLSATGVKAGAVLLFGRHQGGTNAWGEIMRWAPSDVGSTNAQFGWSVALSGDRLVVGAPLYNTVGSTNALEGAVFCLSRNQGGTNAWGLSQTLKAADTSLSKEFGWEVSVDGGLMVVGAPSMTAGAVTNAGRVFIYEMTPGTNTYGLVRELDRRNDTERRFGHSVSVRGNQVFIGAPHSSGSQNLGAAYLYDRPNPLQATWILAEKFTRPSGSQVGLFGTSVRYQQGTAIVGAPAQLDELSNRGEAFMYRFGFNTVPILSYTLTIDPALRWHGNGAATGQTISVVANAFWTAERSATDSWISITGGSAGGGDGTVTYSITSNTVASTRSGTITVSGGGITRSFTVNQVSGGTLLEVSPTHRVHTSAAATGQTVSVMANVPWLATKTASWITITGGTSGSGNGTVTYSMGSNSANTARSASITVTGGGTNRTFTVNQDAALAVLTISPASRTHTSAAALAQTIGVTGNAAWTASETNTWITITGGASGTGTGTVTYSIGANTVTTPRIGVIKVVGGGVTNTFAVNQAGADAVQPWRPSGWVYFDYPYAYDQSLGNWYWFNMTDMQWVLQMASSIWQHLDASGMASGWSYFEWPYAYCAANSSWYYINEVDTQWVINLAAGVWSVFGREPIPGGMVKVTGRHKVGFDTVINQAYDLTANTLYVDIYEVTKEQWDAVRLWGASQGYADLLAGDSKAFNHPVHSVNWCEAVKWCNARSQQAGREPVYYTDAAFSTVYKVGVNSVPYVKNMADGFRLPTEVEWEFLARGETTNGSFPFPASPNVIDHALANYYSHTSYLPFDISATRGYHPTYNDGIQPYTASAGSFVANGYGLYDMAGNVGEWCFDPHPNLAGTDKAVRGGSWYEFANSVLVMNNSGLPPSTRNNKTGFRCVVRVP